MRRLTASLLIKSSSSHGAKFAETQPALKLRSSWCRAIHIPWQNIASSGPCPTSRRSLKHSSARPAHPWSVQHLTAAESGRKLLSITDTEKPRFPKGLAAFLFTLSTSETINHIALIHQRNLQI